MQIVIFPFAFFISLSLYGQQTEFSGLDQVLDEFEKKQQVMGSVAFSEHGVVTYSRAFGYAEVSTQTRADTKTSYRIGSISKMITAAMIMQLMAEEKLQLSDKLSRFYPTWPNADIMTIEHLLRHESGIYNFGTTSREDYMNLNPQTSEDMIAVFENAPTAFKPGEKVEYNNANYVVLSLIIEQIDKRSFAESLDARIIKPLSLNNTHAGGYIDVTQGEANSYFWKKKWIENGDYYSPGLMGAGAFMSTPKDMNVFLYSLFTHRILPETQLLEMLDLKDGMGPGFYEFPFYGKNAYGHAGNIDYFESLSIYFPKDNVAFTICVNGSRKDFNDVLIACLSAYFGM